MCHTGKLPVKYPEEVPITQFPKSGQVARERRDDERAWQYDPYDDSYDESEEEE